MIGTEESITTGVLSTILVFGDSVPTVEALRSLISREGFEIFAIKGCQDVEKNANVQPDLVILDVSNLNSIGRFERELYDCKARLNVPILCLVPLEGHAEADVVTRLGADDYLFKPIRPRELGGRIRMLLHQSQTTKQPNNPPLIERRQRFRRQEDNPAIEPWCVDRRCSVDELSKSVVLEGRQLNLSPTEFELFRLLFNNAGRILSATEIISHVWRDAKRATPSDVHQYMHLLRRKVESDPDNPRWIVTVRGFGYKFVFPAES